MSSIPSGIRLWNADKQFWMIYVFEGFWKGWLWINQSETCSGEKWRRWRLAQLEDKQAMLEGMKSNLDRVEELYPETVVLWKKWCDVLSKEIADEDPESTPFGSVPDDEYSPFAVCGHAEALWGDSA